MIHLSNRIFEERVDRWKFPGLLSGTPMRTSGLRSLGGGIGCGLAGLMIFAALGAAPLLNAMPRGERHESRHEIDHLEDDWRVAVLSKDVAALDALLADDYMAITARGMLQSKDETLASLRNGVMRIKSIEFSERKVRFYGTTALVTSRAEVNGSTAEGDISGSYRYTRVYVRDDKGAWRIVSFEVSRIHDGDDHK